MSAPKLYVQKYRGDDLYSWAVFDRTKVRPLVTGCSLSEARSHMASLYKMHELRQERSK